MGLDVNVICRNFDADRVIPRFSRYLRDYLGYNLTKKPVTGADLYYLSAYFEIQMFKGSAPDGSKMAAYFTHKEERPPGNAKAKLFDRIGETVRLRIATAPIYAAMLSQFGDTVLMYPPIERDLFTIPKRAKNKRIVAGFSGFTYPNKRKGENIARELISSKTGRALSWVACGRGWPVKTQRLKWAEMPRFYQDLDILIVTSTVEGVPLPPLEVLACGGSIVIPRGVGLLDELPELDGIYRYSKGSAQGALKALERALAGRSGVDRGALRDCTDPYSVLAWCEGHKYTFEEVFA